MTSTLYAITSGAGSALVLVAAFIWAVSPAWGGRTAVAVPAPQRVVRWQHVADMERDIWGTAFHHEDVPCCCDTCKPPRRHPIADPKLARKARARIRAAEPRPGTPDWWAAYERGRREMQDKLAAMSAVVPPRMITDMTTDPSTLRDPVEVTALGDSERWYVEGSPP